MDGVGADHVTGQVATVVEGSQWGVEIDPDRPDAWRGSTGVIAAVWS
jgi:hypothetical protein